MSDAYFTTGLQDKNTQSAIELLMLQPSILENLRKAYMGNYGVILSLLGCLDHGPHAKRLADRVIDASGFLLHYILHLFYFLADSHVVNIREDILAYRLKFSLTTIDDSQSEDYLSKAGKSLEK